MTQKNSRARVKQDTIGAEVMEQLYKTYEKATLDEFRDQCFKIIEMSSASSPTRSAFNALLNQSESKKHMLFTITNFFLAGEGKGV